MSIAASIGKVSEALRTLLLTELKLKQSEVTILSPDEVASDEKRINLFLYRVSENAFLKNMDWQPKLSDPNQIMAPPLSLTLFYLLTPYAKPDAETGIAGAHVILGDAMRVFHDFPVIPEAYLDRSLKEVYGQIKLTPTPLSLDDLSKIWNALKNPFRLSAAYEVSLLQLDSASEKAIPKRVEKVELKQTETTFRQPQVLRVDPQRGKMGENVKVQGTDLAGWKAQVQMGGKTILSDFLIEKDEGFSFKVPLDLLPGMYEVSTDVGKITQARFSFEVIRDGSREKKKSQKRQK